MAFLFAIVAFLWPLRLFTIGGCMTLLKAVEAFNYPFLFWFWAFLFTMTFSSAIETSHWLFRFGAIFHTMSFFLAVEAFHGWAIVTVIISTIRSIGYC